MGFHNAKRATVTMASFDCPRGEIIMKPWGVLLHPSDWMIRRHGRTPLFTRYTLGGREAERDRRRHAAKPAVTITREPWWMRGEVPF